MRNTNSERGSARLKFIIAMTVFAIVVYVGYMYVPVAVDAYYFKDAMQSKVNAAAVQGYETSWISDQLEKSRLEFNVPAEAIITPVKQDNQMQVRVQFTRPIAFPGYTYNYQFDYTAKSTSFITIK
ncbi:MAG: hypothetical protein QOK48_1182 [Blastocatellia bacterium]|jgi:hypothetical protein|nr:hypothetical protein [Blastocatellia bacterium]